MQWLTAVVLSLPLVGVYAIFALGIVLIYRASKVLNLAHGVMATAPVYIYLQLTRWEVPVLLALLVGIASGGLLGWIVERTFVRPFRRQGPTAQTVGTVIVLGLGIAIMSQIWGSSAHQVPAVFPEGYVEVGLSNVRYGEFGLFAVMLLVFAALLALFRFTDLGLLMRGAAENPRAAALMGVNPERMTAFTWVLGGSLAAVAGILLATLTAVDPYNLPLQALPGFLAALIGGLGSVVGALVGGAVIGLVVGLVPFLPVLGSVPGSAQMFLALVGLVAMASRGERIAAASEVRTGVVV